MRTHPKLFGAKGQKDYLIAYSLKKKKTCFECSFLSELPLSVQGAQTFLFKDEKL